MAETQPQLQPVFLRLSAMISKHAYEIRPRNDHRGVNLISDALPFGRLWYGELNAVSNAMWGTQSFAVAHLML